MSRLVPFLALLGACNLSTSDTLFPTGSQTLVPNADSTALYVVDTDAGNLVRYNPETGVSTSLAVGSRPVRVARAGDRLYVTLAGERSLAVVADNDGALSLVDTVELGAEPFGVVAREDGERLYVALAGANRVVELATASLEVLRSWDVSGRPAWLALHPGGDALYVGSTYGGGISYVDLRADSDPTELELPEIYGAGSDGNLAFTRRITGDLSFSPDGGSVAVPALFVDNHNPVADPGETSVESDGYGSVGLGVSRFNPSVLVIPVGSGGVPHESETATVLVAGFSRLDEDNNTTAVRSYLTSTAYSPNGELIYATMEASSSVAVISSTPIYPGSSSGEDDIFFDTGGSSISAEAAGFATSPILMIGTDAGPRGVTFLADGQAYVHSWLDQGVAPLRASQAQDHIDDQLSNGFLDISDSLHGGQGVKLFEDVLTPDEDAGRRLFFSATASQMAADGSGVSCSTCHFDGRNDGLTWTFEDGVRQVPSLAGAVGVTAPFTWTLNVESVAAEAQITSEGRMGGNGLSYAEAAQVAAYIETIPTPDSETRGSTDPAVARGQALFESAEVGCSECHTGERMTDNEFHTMYGLTDVNTPGLVGIAASAPYLHDGSAATIREVLESAGNGEMGYTGDLTEDQLADLEAYVLSL